MLYVSYTSITAFGIVHVFFIDPESIICVTANDTVAGQFLRAFFLISLVRNLLSNVIT